MYNSWYLDQYTEYNDLFHGDFEIFSLKYQGSDTERQKVELLDTLNILDWIESLKKEQASSDHGGVTLLLTRHKRHEQHEIKPWYMAFQKDSFRRISDSWNLPSDYLFLRRSAAGCGSYTKHSTMDDQGSISHLGFTIRVPHSPRNNAKAIWSITATWDVTTRHTNAVFEGVSDNDIQEVQNYIHAKSHLVSHPLLLPLMILELLNTFFVHHRREPERSLYLLEHQLGITRGKRQTDVWDWDYELHRESTKHCNGVYTNLVYLERRLEFAVGLSQFLLESLTFLEEEGLLVKQKMLRSHKMIKETVLNNSTFAKRSLHQTLCLQKRCQGLTTVLYTVIAQQDSKINVKIARAAKRDSSSMTAIAVLGFTFLPAMLVASIFSTTMFDFSASLSDTSNTPRSSIITSNFWMYWATTIPLTLGVLLAWKLWMHFHRDKPEKLGEVFKHERMSGMRDADLALNTPFYPVMVGFVEDRRLGSPF